jgi:hypothetical protein
VNALGNEMQKAGKKGYNCATNEVNAARHIWDRLDKDGCMGATACVVVPSFWDEHQERGDWRLLADWIDANLPYSELEFFPTLWAVNVTWSERPKRRVTSYCR